MLLKKIGSYLNFISLNFRSLCFPYLPNRQCRLVEPSFPTVTQLDFGATIPWFLAAPYDLIYDILENNKLYYIIRKVLHQFGKKVHDRVHHYVATLEIVSVDFIDVLWLGDDCTYLFSISDFML